MGVVGNRDLLAIIGLEFFEFLKKWTYQYQRRYRRGIRAIIISS